MRELRKNTYQFKSMRRITIHTDGASKGNPGESGAGVVITDREGSVIDEFSQYLGRLTNNAAEYSALLLGLGRAKELGAEDVLLKTDSELMAHQLNGIYKVKSPLLKDLYLEAVSLLNSFKKAQVMHVGREENRRADELANEGVKKKNLPPKKPVSVKPSVKNKTVTSDKPVTKDLPSPSSTTEDLISTKCQTAAGTELILVKGDCISGMRSLLQENSIDVVVTSPPYNLGINYVEYNDKISREEYLQQMADWAVEIKRILTEKGSLFLNVGSKPSDPYVPFDLLNVMRKHFTLQNTIYWVKSIAIQKSEVGDYPGIASDVVVGHYKPINSKRFINDCAEFIFHFTHNGDVELDRLAVGVPYQDKTNIDRWSSGKKAVHCRGNTWFIPYDTIANREKDRPHPASFPLELPRRCISLHGLSKTKRVLDPFLGIGTTARACAELNVDFIGFEIAQDYYSTALERTKEACTTSGTLPF